MILQELRQAVRDQLDLPEEDDIPTALIDLYLIEGFNTVINREDKWPFYEDSWSVTTDAAGTVALPSTVNAVQSVFASGGELYHVSYPEALEQFGDTEGTPEMFSVWGDTIYVWPKSAADLTVTGWRNSDESWITSAAAAPDTGSERRLDRALVHYACSRAYAQQEDPELAEFYLDTFHRVVHEAHAAIMRPRWRGRVRLGRGIPRRRWSRFTWGV